jgi:hypothetical protein
MLNRRTAPEKSRKRKRVSEATLSARANAKEPAPTVDLSNTPQCVRDK